MAIMKVLLVQSYLGHRADAPVYPLGLAYIGTATQARGHDIQIVDLNVLPDPFENLQRTIRLFNPDCIGFSIRNIDNQSRIDPLNYYCSFQDTLKAAGETAKDIPFVVGGAGFSMFPEDILRRNPQIDFGIHLEAEDSFPELLNHLSSPSLVKGIFLRREGQIVYTGDRPFPDFAALPFPRRDFLDLAPYVSIPFSMGVQTKRGCPMRCAYCNYPHLNGAAYRLRKPDHVVDEIQQLGETFGIKDFTFTDSVFNQPAGHSEAILNEVIRRKLQLSWSAYMHPRGITRDYVRLAMQAGCSSMLFSPDGISRAALNGLQKDVTEKQIADVFALFSHEREFARLHVGFCFFINPPGETFTGLMKALGFFIQTGLSRLRRGTARMRAYVSWIRLEPHTSVYTRAVAEKSWRPEDTLLPDDITGLRKVFYKHPRLYWIDPLLLLGFRAIHLAEHLAKRILRKGVPA